MKPEGPSPCSKQPDADPYPEATQFAQRPNTLLSFNTVLRLHTEVLRVVSLLHVFNKKPVPISCLSPLPVCPPPSTSSSMSDNMQ